MKYGAHQFLYLLLAVPGIIALLAISYHRKKKRLERFIDRPLIAGLTASYNTWLWWLKHALIVAGLACLLISAARPKWGEKLQIYKGKGIDIVVALDASKSMLAQDIKPSRIERAKTDLSALLDNLSTNQVGITAFAGDCYVMCPMTTDIEAAKLFLDIIDPNTVPRPGTNLEKAVAVSASLFDPKEDAHKALILITDGDNLEGNPLPAVDYATSQGIRIFTIGMGTLEGAPVPVTDAQGNLTQYKKDRENNIVISRLADRELMIIAKAGNGRYYRSDGLYINRLLNELEGMRKKEIGGGEYVEYIERYQYFLLAAFLFILAGLFISDRRGPWLPDHATAFIKNLIRSGLRRNAHV
jgi:Ca-activated chloride channel family protein